MFQSIGSLSFPSECRPTHANCSDIDSVLLKLDLHSRVMRVVNKSLIIFPSGLLKILTMFILQVYFHVMLPYMNVMCGVCSLTDIVCAQLVD